MPFEVSTLKASWALHCCESRNNVTLKSILTFMWPTLGDPIVKSSSALLCQLTTWLHFAITLGLVTKNNYHGEFLMAFPNDCHTRVTYVLHCKITWWFVTKQLSWSIFNGFSKWLPHESHIFTSLQNHPVIRHKTTVTELLWGVSKCRSLENKNKKNGWYHISVDYTDCDNSDHL